MTLRIGIIGCGDIFPVHRTAWLRADSAELVGFHDSHPEALARAAKSQKGGRPFEVLGQLLDACDAVVVATPPSSHYDLSAAALKAGCHVLIEKPVVETPEEWYELNRLAKSNDLKVSALHNQKYFEVFERARRWVAEGRIGQVLQVHDQFLVDHEKQLMLNTDAHWCHLLKGGRWTETLPHHLYALYTIAGPLEFVGVCVPKAPSGPPGAEASDVVVSLRDTNTVATISFSATHGPDRRMLTIIGTDGVIEVVPPGRTAALVSVRTTPITKLIGLSALSAARRLIQFPADRIRFARSMVGPSGHDRVADAFVQYVQGTGPNPAPQDEADYVVELTHEIGNAIEGNRWPSTRGQKPRSAPS